MFTGLVQTVGRIVQISSTKTGKRLVIEPENWDYQPGIGDSICVSGCCLTVAQIGSDQGSQAALGFDVIPESLAKTILKSLKEGDQVNLESCVTPTTLLGGHIVQGHVDGVGEVLKVEHDQETGEYRVRIAPPADLLCYTTPKGSITVDGVSLTIAALNTDVRADQKSEANQGWFEVALIPTTLAETTLDSLAPGSRCNLEMDVLAKTVIHWLTNHCPAELFNAAQPGAFHGAK